MHETKICRLRPLPVRRNLVRSCFVATDEPRHISKHLRSYCTTCETLRRRGHISKCYELVTLKESAE